NNPRSLLWWMKRLIALRKSTKVFGRGSIEFLYPDNSKVLAFVREHVDGDEEERVLVVANLSRHAQVCELDLSQFEGLSLVEMSGRTAFPTITDQPYVLTFGPYQFYWFSIERAPSRLTLSKMRQFADEQSLPIDEIVPTVTVSGEWRALLRGRGKERLEAALPAVLRRQRWFGGKARNIRACHITDVAPIGKKDAPALHVLIVRVDYIDGEPEDYVVPVTFAEGEEAGRIEATTPGAVLAQVKGQGQRGQSGILYDAMQSAEAGAALLDTSARGRKFKTNAGEVVGRRRKQFGTARELAELSPTVLRGEQSNTSVLFDDQYLMKILRRLEPGTSPDVEIGNYLAHDAGLEHVPELVGTIDYEPKGAAEPRTLAMVQRFVANEGDAWSFTLDELERFSERMLTEPPEEAGRVHTSALPDPVDLAQEDIPETVHDVIGPYLDAAILLGRRTAELHQALAASDRKAFAPEPFTELYQRSLYQSMRNTLRRGLQSAAREAKTLEAEDDRSKVRELAGRESEILRRLRTLSDVKIDAQRIRTHGDYHLGQVLWTGRDFVIIDFEGEPARPLGERRLKRSPLRDVAGMIRSFHYAASSALRFQRERGAFQPDSEQEAELGDWLMYWYRWVSAAFLRGYVEQAGEASFLPSDPEHLRILLDAFLLEKAVYELGYEMNNRPDWVSLPLGGIAEVLGDLEASS
ncbi:MAG: putative maltokinase, partial [Nitriliruptorales bacterium]|nr:putative maltokinase [Nitriliruptorales bacterium]